MTTIKERIENAAISAGNEKCWSADPIINERIQQNRMVCFEDGAHFGFAEAIKDVLVYLHKYREAYPEDIFEPIKKDEQDVSRDRVSGQMARFILDNCIRDFESQLTGDKG